jgi:hypothetical protein
MLRALMNNPQATERYRYWPQTCRRSLWALAPLIAAAVAIGALVYSGGVRLPLGFSHGSEVADVPGGPIIAGPACLTNGGNTYHCQDGTPCITSGGNTPHCQDGTACPTNGGNTPHCVGIIAGGACCCAKKAANPDG